MLAFLIWRACFPVITVSISDHFHVPKSESALCWLGRTDDYLGSVSLPWRMSCEFSYSQNDSSLFCFHSLYLVHWTFSLTRVRWWMSSAPIVWKYSRLLTLESFRFFFSFDSNTAPKEKMCHQMECVRAWPPSFLFCGRHRAERDTMGSLRNKKNSKERERGKANSGRRRASKFCWEKITRCAVDENLWRVVVVSRKTKACLAVCVVTVRRAVRSPREQAPPPTEWKIQILKWLYIFFLSVSFFYVKVKFPIRTGFFDVTPSLKVQSKS